MNNFIYYAPTKVVFGKDTQQQVGSLISDYGYKKVLLHYGGSSAAKSGLLDVVKNSLTAAGIDFVELGGVVPNPRLSKVYEGIELGRANNIDFILAVGGGSVIDSAKGISYGVPYAGDVWDFFTGKATPKEVIPTGAILTLAAAGSEMSNSTVITNEDGWLKRGCNFDIIRLKFVIENPELTYSLPKYQTSAGIVDIFMHTLERYFTTVDTMEVTDQLAEALLRTVILNAHTLMSDPTNYKARAEIMWASSLSHNGLLAAGTDGGDWACHKLEHELSGMFDVAHAPGLSAIWSSWATYVYKEKPARFARYAKNVFGLEGENDLDLALKGIEATDNFFKSINMPISIKGLGLELTDSQINELADKCCLAMPIIGNFKKLHKEDMIAIYKLANKKGN